jgi:hypothetical protein
MAKLNVETVVTKTFVLELTELELRVLARVVRNISGEITGYRGVVDGIFDAIRSYEPVPARFVTSELHFTADRERRDAPCAK